MEAGGFTKSPVWLQIMANAFDRPIGVPEWGETAAFGASLWAMLSAGVIDNIEQGAKLSKLGETYKPSPSIVEIYNQMYQKFKQLYLSLVDEFNE